MTKHDAAHVGYELIKPFFPVIEDMEIEEGERLAEAFVSLIGNLEQDEEIRPLVLKAETALSDLLNAVWKRSIWRDQT